jgi:hypothetical protein
MATLNTVLTAMEKSIVTATAGLISTAPSTNGQTITVLTGLGWPSIKTLQDNVRASVAPQVLLTVYDRGLAHDTTRWKPVELFRTTTAATITATLDPTGGVLQPGQSATITFGGTATPGDAVAALVTPSFGNGEADVAVAGAADTPDTMATTLAALITNDAGMTPLVTATASGSHVTLTSQLSAGNLTVKANIGNGAVRTREIGRRNRPLQIVIWTRTQQDRITIGDAIEANIASLEANFGLTFSDGTMGRVLYMGDQQFDDAKLADTYRRDFLASVDYPVTTTDAMFAVLAPVTRFTIL